MSWTKFLLDKIVDHVDKALSNGASKTEPTALATEEDILKAIDDLPGPPPVPTEPVVNVPKGYGEDDRMVEVPKPQSWSLFKYLGKPEYHGLTSVEKDKRMYFTIPCGWEWDDAVKFWFITFPLGGDSEDVVEFFTLMQMVQ